MEPEDQVTAPESEQDVIREGLAIAEQERSDLKGADNARGLQQRGDAGAWTRLIFSHEAFIA
jgi:hypothetical protein